MGKNVIKEVESRLVLSNERIAKEICVGSIYTLAIDRTETSGTMQFIR